jgi:hypothetical protein
MNEHWQQQLQLAAESRQASSPHYYARAVAQQTKGIQIAPSQPEAQENGVKPKNGVVKTQASQRQGWHSLDFGGQGLRAISTNLFSYLFLEKLYLSHNKLKLIPPEIGQLRGLTHLDLSSNELTALPEEIGMLTNLKQLLLFDNHIRTLPYEMGYLYRLEILGIEGNPLEDVFKSLIMKEGTKALIKYLKEEMPGQYQCASLMSESCADLYQSPTPTSRSRLACLGRYRSYLCRQSYRAFLQHPLRFLRDTIPLRLRAVPRSFLGIQKRAHPQRAAVPRFGYYLSPRN